MTPATRRRSPTFVVRDHRPWRGLLLSLLLGVVLGASALLVTVVHHGEVLPLPGPSPEAGTVPATRLLEQRLAATVVDNERLRAELAVLRRQQQVEHTAEQSAAAHLFQLQDQISALRQEVAFYRGIVAGGRGRGFEVQSFAAMPGQADGRWRFRVVLTNDAKDANVRTGFVSLSVDGEQGGEPKRLSLRELTGRSAPGFEFRFRVYQKVEGALELPAGFTPRVVNVEITGADGAVSGAGRSFDWPGNAG